MRNSLRRGYERAREYVTDPDRWDSIEADRRQGGFVGMQATLAKFTVEYTLTAAYLAPLAVVVGVLAPDVALTAAVASDSVVVYWVGAAFGLTQVTWCGTSPGR